MHILPKETRLEILRLCGEGMAVSAISRQLKVSKQSVVRYRDLGSIGYEKQAPRCKDCDIPITDAVSAKYCASHRAQRRSAGLHKSHSIIQVYRPTKEIDDIIRRASVEGTPSLTTLAKRFRWTLHAVARRANALGFERPRRGKLWSQEELDFIERNAHLSAVTIYKRLKNKGFKRSESSIRTKLARLNLPRGGDATASSIGLGFGVTYSVVVNWINRGQLKARKRGGNLAKYDRDWWIIQHDDIREFVLRNPLAFDIRKVDQLWFIELVSGGMFEKPSKIAEAPLREINEDAEDVLNTYQIAV